MNRPQASSRKVEEPAWISEMRTAFPGRLLVKGAWVRGTSGRTELLCEEEFSVLGEAAPHPDDLVGEGPLGIGKAGPAAIEEDGRLARRILQVHEPVAVRRRPDIEDHADDHALLLAGSGGSG